MNNLTSFPLRRPNPVPHRLSDLAGRLGLPAPGPDPEVRGVAPVRSAAANQIGFLAHRRYVADLEESEAGALLVSRELDELLPPGPPPRLVVEDPHQALATLLECFHPEEEAEPGIHATAVLGPGTRLGKGVRIGPYAVLEGDVEVGDGARIGAHVVVGTGAAIGKGAVLHPHAVVYPRARLGDGAILQAGACLGVEGFGYVFRDGVHRKVAQVGGCIVEAEVEIGANTTVDRGSIGETRIGRGAKLDNLIQVGHNSAVGATSVLAAQTGLAGSARLEEGVLAGGQVGVGGHLTVGKGARLAAQAGIIGDVPAGETVMGFPARPRGEFLRTTAAQGRVPELLRRVRALEREVVRLSGTDEGGPEACP